MPRSGWEDGPEEDRGQWGGVAGEGVLMAGHGRPEGWRMDMLPQPGRPRGRHWHWGPVDVTETQRAECQAWRWSWRHQHGSLGVFPEHADPESTR